MLTRVLEDFAGRSGGGFLSCCGLVVNVTVFFVAEKFQEHLPTGQISVAEWSAGAVVGGFNGQLEVYMKKFEDPTQSDPMSRLQNDLDETKIVLVSLGFY